MKLYDNSGAIDAIYFEVSAAGDPRYKAWVCLTSRGEMRLCSHHNIEELVHKKNLQIIDGYWREHVSHLRNTDIKGRTLYNALKKIANKAHE